MLKVLAAFFAVAVVSSSAWADSATNIKGRGVQVQDGAGLYQHLCQGCHMPGGVGARGAGAVIPALRANPKLGNATYPAYTLLHGFGGMPSFGKMLTDAQVASVVNYVRTHFDNHATDTIDAAAVKELR